MRILQKIFNKRKSKQEKLYVKIVKQFDKTEELINICLETLNYKIEVTSEPFEYIKKLKKQLKNCR